MNNYILEAIVKPWWTSCLFFTRDLNVRKGFFDVSNYTIVLEKAAVP